MQTEWNRMLAERRDTEIVEAMRILLPEIDSVSFLGWKTDGAVS